MIVLLFGTLCGHGWLHGNQFGKTYQKMFGPSWRCLRCMMAY